MNQIARHTTARPAADARTISTGSLIVRAAHQSSLSSVASQASRVPVVALAVWEVSLAPTELMAETR